MHYYTYAYLREDRTPYYIGKGKGSRIYRKTRRIKPPKDKSRIIFLKQNLTEEEAFKHEIYMIAVFGRIDLRTGILHNMTNGGEGGSGRVLSEETRRKLSDANRGKNHPNYGKTTSLETKAKMSASKKNMSDETRAKYSAANTGENHPFYGKTHSPETRAKYSTARKGRKWWNDGCGNCKIMIEYPGDGWRLGRK
ncbi:MAG: NUMOD3 domain-containing DNA-binding protein [Nitrosarchaeum sp.]|nr:NUMOD3 domain-containing DNA-binding protein [Nitrosarchaeum sp.]